MKPGDLTDEQFREARRQIVAVLRAQAENATKAAANAITSTCENYQNPPSGLERHRVERARALRIAASMIANMEREGYDWMKGQE